MLEYWKDYVGDVWDDWTGGDAMQLPPITVTPTDPVQPRKSPVGVLLVIAGVLVLFG